MKIKNIAQDNSHWHILTTQYFLSVAQNLPLKQLRKRFMLEESNLTIWKFWQALGPSSIFHGKSEYGMYVFTVLTGFCWHYRISLVFKSALWRTETSGDYACSRCYIVRWTQRQYHNNAYEFYASPFWSLVPIFQIFTFDCVLVLVFNR